MNGEDAIQDRARLILELLLRFRRSLPGDPCAGAPCDTCFATHRPKIERYLASGEPLHFVILAFPAKSPNPSKTLGPLPDLAERLSLDFLQRLCDQVAHVHRPGARLTVCTDGHVFSDLVCVPDDDVSTYRNHVLDILEDIGGTSLDLYSLADAYAGQPHDGARKLMVEDWAQPIEDLRDRVRRDRDARALFNGIHRFMFEDQTVLRPTESRSKVRTECKKLAYQVIQRSDAWSRLVADAFPDAVRLSIHPQPSHSPKLGIHMMTTRDAWLTPWHGTVLDDGISQVLVKRSEAERLRASVVFRRGRPSHFAAPYRHQEVSR